MCSARHFFVDNCINLRTKTIQILLKVLSFSTHLSYRHIFQLTTHTQCSEKRDIIDNFIFINLGQITWVQILFQNLKQYYI